MWNAREASEEEQTGTIANPARRRPTSNVPVRGQDASAQSSPEQEKKQPISKQNSQASSGRGALAKSEKFSRVKNVVVAVVTTTSSASAAPD